PRWTHALEVLDVGEERKHFRPGTRQPEAALEDVVGHGPPGIIGGRLTSGQTRELGGGLAWRARSCVARCTAPVSLVRAPLRSNRKYRHRAWLTSCRARSPTFSRPQRGAGSALVRRPTMRPCRDRSASTWTWMTRCHAEVEAVRQKTLKLTL